MEIIIEPQFRYQINKGEMKGGVYGSWAALQENRVMDVVYVS